MLKIYIDGMMCEHCISYIKAALGDLEGMHEIREISLKDKYALVSCSTDEDILRNAIKDEGYSVTKIEQC
ncbi:heavy-metal-associated domain-containing protein [Pectinatus haikarae]|uniref:Copper chaperone n=1 Tax=Pectinatus haikarae TaxID=349096 RepID=A0ABT9YA24_9FIRM|nr:heavy metal-associated domain-containing protein [Pectinatus haikarae]MDQ0204345.1 copper chaperone [Pectinatus haikarae]